MTFLEYQQLAMRTQAIKNDKKDMLIHAVCGLSSELGEIIQVYDDMFLHNKKEFHLLLRMESELGDFCWFQAELCKALDISIHYQNLDNIDQLILSSDDKCKYKQIGYYIDKLIMLNGIISGSVQKVYQGKEINKEKITEILYMMNIIINTIAGQLLDRNIEEIWKLNIGKLKKRFPEGFDKELDSHRQEGDL